MEQNIASDGEYKNELLQVEVIRHPACVVELKVTTVKKLNQESYQQAVKRVAKEVSIAGFRKGKAPEDLIQKNYAPQIQKQWDETLADLAFRESEKLVRIPPLNNEMKVSFKIHHKSLEDSSQLSLYFETEPQPPSIDPKILDLKPVEKPAVNEEKIEETIRQVLMFFAEWKKITQRPVQMNDFVLLDVEALDETPPKKLFSSVRFEVTERSMAHWMRELILGRSVGESLEGTSIPDANDSSAEQMAAKPVRVSILAIEEATLPVCDDLFAQKLGAASVAEMRTKISDLLHKQASDHVREKQREQIVEILLQKVQFDIPKTLIERETRYRMHQLLQDPEYQKYWGSMTPQARQRTIESIQEQAGKAVKMFYLCRKILADADIRVSPADLQEKTGKAPLNMLLNANDRDQSSQEMHQAEAFSRLLLEKAEDYLIEQATLAQ